MSAVGLVDQIMAEPIGERAGFLRHDPKLRERLVQLTGTPWYIWQDSPVSFVQNVLGEATWQGQRDILASCWDHERTAVAACHAPGKAVRHGTPVLTPSGWVKVEDVRPGMLVVGGDGQPHEVAAVWPQGVRPMLRFTWNDGTTTDCDPDHLWETVVRRGARRGEREVIRAGEIAARGHRPRGWARTRIPTVAPVWHLTATVPLDPYLVGALLGDGHMGITPRFTTADPEMLTLIGRPDAKPTKHRPYDYPILGISQACRDAGIAGMVSASKHVPDAYLLNDEATRRAVLAGLLDTDGSVSEHDGSVEFCVVSRELAADTAELARSLGWRASVPVRRSTWYTSGGDRIPAQDAWRVRIVATEQPFRLTRKAEVWSRIRRAVTADRLLVAVDEVEPGEATCLTVDGGTFVLGGHVVTHNTHIAARAAAWFVATRPFGTAQVVTTAPTWRQVKNLLWPHIRRLHGLRSFPGRIGENAEWRIGDHLAAFGFSPSDYDEAAAQGIHSPYVMVIVDEAGGISRARFQALEGVMSAGFARMLCIGNPATDDESTAFEDRFYSPSWNGVRIAAFDTPNFTGEATDWCACIEAKFRPHRVAEHLTQPSWVESVREDFGEDSAYWIARVEAKFPHGLTQRTIPLAFIEAAMEREAPAVASDTCSLGVDIASDGGDELAFAVGRGWDVQFLEGRAGAENADALKVAHRIRQHIEGDDVGWEGLISAQRRVSPHQRAQVKIDAIGLGWGVVGVVRAWVSEFMWPVDVVAVQVGERPNGSGGQKRFLNKRAEMWWSARELLKDTARLRVDKRTVAQLAGPTYDITSSGLIKIESKDDMRRRGLQSPDRAEAVLLALYDAVHARPASASVGAAVEARLPGVRRRL